jgi:hypothetical protein
MESNEQPGKEAPGISPPKDDVQVTIGGGPVPLAVQGTPDQLQKDFETYGTAVPWVVVVILLVLSVYLFISRHFKSEQLTTEEHRRRAATGQLDDLKKQFDFYRDVHNPETTAKFLDDQKEKFIADIKEEVRNVFPANPQLENKVVEASATAATAAFNTTKISYEDYLSDKKRAFTRRLFRHIAPGALITGSFENIDEDLLYQEAQRRGYLVRRKEKPGRPDILTLEFQPQDLGFGPSPPEVEQTISESTRRRGRVPGLFDDAWYDSESDNPKSKRDKPPNS